MNDTPIDDRDSGIISLGGRKLLITWFASTLFRTWGASDPNFAVPSDEDDEKFVGSWVRLSDDAGASWGEPVKVAVMGCEVNGPGEAKDADVGIAAGNGRAIIFRKGQKARVVVAADMLTALMEEVEQVIAERRESAAATV